MSCWRAKNRAVVLVIDKSGSMRDDDRIIYAPFLRAVSPERMAGTLKNATKQISHATLIIIQRRTSAIFHATTD